jgi:hypothetical protein
MKGMWGFPKNQNGRIGCKAETLIFSVCTDTGCACYSLKSQYPQIVVPLLFRKRGHFFILRYLKNGRKMSVV